MKYPSDIWRAPPRRQVARHATMTGDMTTTFEVLPQTNIQSPRATIRPRSFVPDDRHERIDGAVVGQYPTYADQFSR